VREDTSLSLKLKENIDYKIENVKNVDTYVRLKSVREISQMKTHTYISNYAMILIISRVISINVFDVS